MVVRKNPAAAQGATRPRVLRVFLLQGGVFALALFVPIPAAPNTARAEVVERLADGLPLRIEHTLARHDDLLGRTRFVFEGGFAVGEAVTIGRDGS